MRRAAAVLLPTLLMACGSGNDEATVPVTIANNGQPVSAPTALPAATGKGTALGLTKDQLEDAHLVGPTGGDMGEVDEVRTDANGTVSALQVELPDGRKVERTLDGLTPVPDGKGGWNLRTPANR